MQGADSGNAANTGREENERDILIRRITELQSIAQTGLFYGKDKFDLERYERIREISAELLAMRMELPLDKVKELFCSDFGYQTPKVDTRAAIFRDGRILLVKEMNGTWSMPGGWCDYDLSPADNTVKEAREESGRDVAVRRVIAVQDRKKHNVPLYAYDVVKIFYLCEELGGQFEENIETSACDYFSEDELPLLAGEKCNEEQVKMCFEASRDPAWQTRFD